MASRDDCSHLNSSAKSQSLAICPESVPDPCRAIEKPNQNPTSPEPAFEMLKIDNLFPKTLRRVENPDKCSSKLMRCEDKSTTKLNVIGKVTDDIREKSAEICCFHEHTWQTLRISPKSGLGHNPDEFLLCLPSRKLKWIKKPKSFDEVVQLAKTHQLSTYWWQIPHVMAFPEFSGYMWMHESTGWEMPEFLQRKFSNDQLMFERIVLASCRMSRPPLCSPDYFHFGERDKRYLLKALFQNRCNIREVRWNFKVQAKHEQHPDWHQFCQYFKDNVPTGEFLFEPDVWDEKWFARTIVEKNIFPVRQEIIDFVGSCGFIVKPRWKLTGSYWSKDNCKVIEDVAFRFWTKWRKEAERRLRASKSHP